MDLTHNINLRKRMLIYILCFLFVCMLFAIQLESVSAQSGDVSGVVKGVWNASLTQIKDVVNSVVFPALAIIDGVALFAKSAMAYFDYRKQGMFDWVAPAVLFVCLIFILLAPNYIWNIVG